MSVSAIAELYDQHGARLYRYALMILADPAAAEDVVHDAFVRLARVAAGKPALATVAYLTAIVRNECFSVLRRRRRRPSAETPLLDAESPDASEEDRLVLESALRMLPPEQREVIHLKVFEGLTFQEIGERCGVSLNTAASRYRYAIAALRTSMAEIDRSKT